MKRFSTILKLSFFLCFLLAGIATASAQTLYWVNGSGSWNESSHWSLSSGGAGGAGVPTLANDVVFDKKSFTQTGAIVTIDAAAYCNNLTWKKTKVSTSIAGPSTIKLTLNGSLSVEENIKNSFSGTLAFIGDGEKTISSKTQIENDLIFLGKAKWIIADDNSIKVKNIRIIEGQLISSNDKVIASAENIFSSAPQKVSGAKRQVASVTIVTTIPTCNGGTNGNAVITVTGGTPPYSYQLLDWTNFVPFPTQNTAATTVTFNNLYATEYLLRISDATADPAVARFFTIGQPGVLALTTTPTNISCSGSNDGKILATATGGTTNYTYTLKKGGVAVGLPQTVAGSHTFTGLVAGNDYTVELNDANSCGPVTQGPLTIIDPVALGGSVTAHTDILCFGTSTGSITATATNGTAPYEYSIDGGAYQASGTFNGLAAGNHTVAIRDVNLCSITLPAYPLTQPATAVSGSISSQTNVSCFGGNDGAVTVAGAGGVGPYQYSLDGGAYQASGTFGTLIAGSYTVTVRDANSCTKDIPVTITQPAAALGGSISAQTNVSCNGGNNGSVTVAGSGGTAPYQYKLDAGAYQASGTFGTLTAGTHTVTVQDAKSCTFPVAVTITQPVVLSGSITAQTNVACNGTNTGSVTVAGADGTSPYQYSLNGGAYQASGTFGTLTAGAYTVTVKDANGCTVPVAVTITQPATPVSGSISSQTNVNCFGDNTGSVTVAGAGGTAPYQYKLDAGAYQASGTFGTLLATSYTVTVRDANLCTKDVTVTITQPATALSGSITSQTNVLCKGNNTGSVTVAGAGGTAPYQYKLDAGAYQASGTFGTLIAGTYTVTVMDAKSCTNDVAVTITEPAAGVGGSITSQTNVLCFGDNSGSVTVAGSGGTSPYQYSLDGGAYQASGTFGTLTSGSYTVTVKDAGGCTFPVAVTITQPANALTGTISAQTDVACFGNSSGSVTVTGVNGTVPYQYSFEGGAYSATNTYSSLAAGSYTVSVKDAGGCLASVPITITQPAAALSGSITTQTDVGCNGGNNGSVTVAGAGGTAPYQYSLNGGAYQASGTFGTLTAGVYTVTIQDAKSCTYDVAVTITQPAAALTGSITTQTSVSCFGGNDAAVTVAGADGTAPYQYSLNGGAYQASGTFTTLTAGAYTVTVKDANSCTKDVAVTITQPAASLSGSVTSQTNLTCNGGNDGAVTVAASGGTSPYTYSIDGGAFGPSATFTNLSGTNHTVVINDANGCTFNIPVTLIEPAAINITGEVVLPVTGCFGNTNGSITITASGGTGALSYSIDGGTTFQATGSFINLAAGSYQVVIKDANNCIQNGSLLTVNQPAQLAFTFTTKDLTCNSSANGEIHFTASGGTPPYQYSILGGTPTSWKLSPDFVGLTAGTYSLKVKDANGCTTIAPVAKVNQPAAIGTDGGTWKDVTTCNGDNTGSITVNVTGGIPPFSFSIDGGTTWQATGEFLNLFAGTYTVIVKDGNGCTTSVGPNTINEPSKITITAEIVEDVTICWYNTNGSIVVLATGGTDDLEFSIDGGTTWQTDGFFNNLGVGTYQVAVKDAKGCIKNGSLLTIAGPPPIVVDPTSTTTNVTCNGGNDGQISLVVTGGTGALSYTLNPGGVTNATGLFTSLIAGTYTISITDANNCTLDHVVTITEPAPITFTSQAFTDITCNGANNGTITIVAGGGIAPYQYSIDGGLTYPNATGLFTGLGAGSYTVNVKDANGCIIVGNTYTITDPTPVTITSQTSTNSGCFGSNSGTITVVATGGTAPLTYTLKNGAVTVTSNTTGAFSSVAPGTYTVEVNDANGCGPVISNPFTITEPTPLTYTLTTTNLTCGGSTTPDGKIVVDVTGGGTAPYTFTCTLGAAPIPLSVVSNTATASSLAAGDYTITITDANSCDSTFTVTLTEPPAIIIDSQAFTDITCNGANNGTITIVAGGGVAPYQYSIDGGLTYPNVTGLFTGLGAGSYTVNVKDANGCIIVGNTYTITDPTAVTITSQTSTNSGCFGSNSGSITVVASGGVAPLTYNLLDGLGAIVKTQTDDGAFTNVVPGTYTVEVIDANSCGPIVAGPFTITEASELTATSIATDVKCNGDADGTITVTASGGTPPYTYSFDGGAFGASNTINGLSGGSHNITVRDAANCEISIVQNIVEAPVLTISLTGTDPSCHGMAIWNGKIVATSTGGTFSALTPMLYRLDGGVWTTTPTFNNVAPGAHTVTVMDANNCTAVANVTLIEPTAVSVLNVSTVDPTCTTLGSITITGQGGSGTYTYTLNPGGATNATGVFSGLGGGTYNVDINDSKGCGPVNSGAIVINSPTTLTITNVVVTDVTSCYGNDEGALDIQVAGATGTVVYSIDGGATWGNTSTFTNLPAGSYSIQVNDDNNCITGTLVQINEPAQIVLTVDQTIEPTPSLSDGEIHVSATGGTGLLTFVLNPGAVTNTTGIFTGLPAGIYSVTVTDANGCSQTITDIGLSDFTVAISATDMSCNRVNNGGILDGIITLTITGLNCPVPPCFTVKWTKDGIPYDSEMTPDYKNLGPGTYGATVTNLLTGKVLPEIFATINEPAAITITNVVVGAPDICAGKNQGTITIEMDPAGGPYEYSIDNGATFVPTNVFSNLPSGSYDVVVRVGACSAAYTSNPIVLDYSTVPDPIVATQDPASGAAVVCPEDKTSDLTITVTGGVPAYTYSWDDGSTDLNRTGLGKGDHTLTVTDQNSCSLVSIFTIAGPADWKLTAAYDSVVCRFIDYSNPGPAKLGKIDVTATGGTPGYTYTWQRNSDDEANLPPFTWLNNSAFDLYPTTKSFTAIKYQVAVTDSKGCMFSGSYTLPYKVHIKSEIVSQRMVDLKPVKYWDRDTACYKGKLMLWLDTAKVNRNFDNVFSWSTVPNILGSGIFAKDTIYPIFSDTTIVKAVVMKTVNGETCFDWDTLKVHLYPRIGVKAIKDEKFEDEHTIVLPLNTRFDIMSTITTNNLDAIYFWSDPSLFTPSDESKTSILIPLNYPLQFNTTDRRFYTTIYAIATDTVTGCIDSSAVKVKVLKDISIPNAFSPNDDGINDTWAIWDVSGVPINFIFPRIEVEVFNRWGSRVFHSSGYNKPWDGKSTSGGDLPVGTYYYVIKYNRDGYSSEVGSVTILR